MLESLLSVRHSYTKYYEGTVLKTLPCPGKSTFAAGMVDNKILYVGGAADNSTYPATNPLITLSTDGLSVTSSTTVSGYEGTWLSGAVNGDDFWYMVGHTGSYQKTFKKRSVSTGALTRTVTTFPSIGRTTPVITNIGSNNLLVGYGDNASGTIADFYNFNTVTEVWTPLPSWTGVIRNFVGTYNKIDGNAYIGMTNDLRLIRYDPVTKVYSTTASFQHYNRIGKTLGLNSTSVVSYGKYILIFIRNLKEGRDTELSVLRYDTELNRFSVFNLTGFPARIGGGVVFNETNNLIYYISGSPLPTGNIDATIKYKDMLVFDASQFARED